MELQKIEEEMMKGVNSICEYYKKQWEDRNTKPTQQEIILMQEVIENFKAPYLLLLNKKFENSRAPDVTIIGFNPKGRITITKKE